jgi:ParB-like chromosome segregation protein Spo0J
VPYARNARTHSDEQVGQIAASIKEWGWTTPVLVDEDGSIIAGHGRTLAAQRLQMTEVPVMVAKGWSEAKKRAYVLADNKLAMNAGWDNEMLALELGEIGDLGFDLDLTGFTADEIAALTPEQIEPGLTDEDEVPELPEQPVTVLGDVWMLGQASAHVRRQPGRQRRGKTDRRRWAQLLHADPPYGMGKAADGVANDNIYKEDLDKFQMEWWATFARFWLTMPAPTFGVTHRTYGVFGITAGWVNPWSFAIRSFGTKIAIPGMKSDLLTQFPIASEHCLFFQFGNQFRGDINTEDFPADWEPVQSYLAGEATEAASRRKM